MPQKSVKPGFHIHVSPGRRGGRSRFLLDEYKAIAFGTVFFDVCIYHLLPVIRRENEYCMANTTRSEFLRDKGIDVVKGLLDNVESERDLIKVMQGACPKQRRYVLWNFENIAPKDGQQRGTESGTVEFRGGRGLRGEVKTKRWIAFTIVFIHLCQEMVRFMKTQSNPSRQPVLNSNSSLDARADGVISALLLMSITSGRNLRSSMS